MDHAADTAPANVEKVTPPASQPLWRIETMAQVKRTYEIHADTDEEACELLNAHASDALVHEEDINEDIDDVTLISRPPLPPDP